MACWGSSNTKQLEQIIVQSMIETIHEKLFDNAIVILKVTSQYEKFKMLRSSLCFTTGDVHIELVSDRMSEANSGSLRRFFASRGKTSNIY